MSPLYSTDVASSPYTLDESDSFTLVFLRASSSIWSMRASSGSSPEVSGLEGVGPEELRLSEPCGDGVVTALDTTFHNGLWPKFAIQKTKQ